MHGDDFVAVGKEEDISDARKSLEDKYKLKVQNLGDGKNCVDDVRILNKIIRYIEDGIELEGDPRRAEFVVKEL